MGIINKLFSWIRKSDPVTSATPGFHGGGYATIDSYGKRRKPSGEDLVRELKNVSYVCASINAATCASFPPQLYVRNAPGMSEPKCATHALDRRIQARVKSTPWLQGLVAPKDDIVAVTDHPMLELIAKANQFMSGQELLELTTLYQEVVGVCYWMLLFDPIGRPSEIWPMPSQHVFPRQSGATNQLDFRSVFQVDYYEWLVVGQHRTQTIKVPPQVVIDFKYPNPRDPYRGHLSPLEAMMESVNVNSEFLAHQQAIWENRARPDAIVSPQEYMGEDERARMEEEWNLKFRQGGAGRVLFAESKMNVTPLAFNVNEIALLAQHGVTKEDICNGFGVPLAYLTKETNMANLQASMQLYMQHAIQPRLHRRDQKLTETLCRLYDPTGRLFVSSEDPVPEDVAAKREQARIDLEHGVITINEERKDRGLPAVPWGDFPWLPNWFLPANDDNPDERVKLMQGGKEPGGKAALYARS